MSEIKYYSEEGLQKLKDELHHLIAIERPAASAAIAEARDKGDLSENAEYDAAKDHLEARISKLQDLVANARLLDESKIDTSKVLLLSIITIRNTKNKMEQKYTIVPESEANLKLGKISITSPFASAFLGHKVGDVVEVNVPAGKMNFELIKIER